ncbi:MAG: ATP-dependent protease ATPase subunit HslU [Firmicutes bacterium]|nr:ATP-dependent protease ATPase subunit HslU [Bacillota bacterium]
MRRRKTAVELTPSEIVNELDKYIVGQKQAKRAVAIALRNRYRRKLLHPDIRDEVIPKNILMIGPTGVGKTEIARRLAKLANAPFVKVEATKFTEVGYVGRDIDAIIRDLIESAIRMVKAERMKEVEDKAKTAANDRLLDILVPMPKKTKSTNHLGMMLGIPRKSVQNDEDDQKQEEQVNELKAKRKQVRRMLELGELENNIIEIDVIDQTPHLFEAFSAMGMEDVSINIQDMFESFIPKKKKKRRTTIAEARKIFTNEEANKLIDMESISSEAVERCEQSGIVFIDEIDKIAGKSHGTGPDVSREGVQRDILPIVEGSTVMTKYGPVKTDYILFIAAGAFHITKPSDLIPELQGRFPIRVELSSLTRNDFKRILTEPKNALIKQYCALLKTENVNIEFSPDGIDEIAQIAEEVNQNTEDIGARRLHTILERLLENLLFEADKIDYDVKIDREYVQKQLGSIIANRDLSRYIL